MEQENLKTNTDSSQITFKLAPEERQYIEKEAEKFDVTISEYIRIKVLDNADQIFKVKAKLIALEKENKRLQIRLSRFQEMELAPDGMVLPINQEIREIFELMFINFDSNLGSTEQKIVQFVLLILTRKNTFKELAYDKNITIDRIEIALDDFVEEIKALQFENSDDNVEEEDVDEDDDFSDDDDE